MSRSPRRGLRVLGLKVHGHDTGACLLVEQDGFLDIVAVSEARLNRRKHSYTYPLLAISRCLDHFGLAGLNEVDMVCIDRHHHIWPEQGSQFGLQAAALRRGVRDLDLPHSYAVEQSLAVDGRRVHTVNHVDAHAASAFFASGAKCAAVLSVEGGVGVYRGDGFGLEPIIRLGYGAPAIREGRVVSEHGPGLTGPSPLFDTVTRRLGFDNFAGGKTMALAAYGHRFQGGDGFPVPEPSERLHEFVSGYARSCAWIEQNIPRFDAAAHPDGTAGLVAERWVRLARQAQDLFESDVLSLATYARECTDAVTLCIAGGCALSCVANRHLFDTGLFEHIYVQPAASDEGIPLGCALYGYHVLGGGTMRWTQKHAWLGPMPTSAEAASVVAKVGLPARPARPEEVAGLLASGRFVGRVAGRSEYGPRALGNRSIFADPRRAEVASVLNRQVKHREVFRPFAPICLQEHAAAYFDLPVPSPFMTMAASVQKEARALIPGAVHVDGSARVQTIRRVSNPAVYDLVAAFGALTGVPVLLNTSLNDDGEPIVETVEDALVCMGRTGLHHLVAAELLIDAPENGKALADDLAQCRKQRIEAEYAAARHRLCVESRFSDAMARIEAVRAGRPDEAQAR